ncbi:MAG: hypothetical protein RL134_1635 [Actinomycetota bacterium]
MSGSDRLRTIADRVGSRWCCSWQVALALVALGVVVTTGWGTTRGGLTVGEYLLAELLADTAGGGVLLLASVTVMRHRNRRTVPLALVIAVWAAVGLARGIVLAQFYLEGVEQILSATLSLTAWALLVIYLAATFAEERSRTRRLQQANAELLLVRGSMEELLQEERSRLVEAVRQAVAPEITRLRQLVMVLDRPADTQAITALADRVAAYSTDVVRETSMRLRHDDDVSLPTTPDVDRAARAPGVLRSYATARQPIVIPMALIAIKAVSVWASQDDPSAALWGFLGLVSVAGLAIMVRAVADRFFRRPSVSELVSTTALIAAVALALMEIFDWARAGAVGPTYVPLAMIGFFVFAVLAAGRLAVGMEWRWANQTEEWKRVNDDLEQANRHLRDEVHAAREQLAGILHGPVQGRLAAASMALRMYVAAREAGDPGDLSATVAMATTLLDRARADIDRLGVPESPDAITFEEGVARISRNWSGLLEIDADIHDPWQRPPDVMAGCLDLIAELVTNASRHGDARHVSLRVVGLDERRLRIEAVDDGSGPTEHVREGQGLAGVRRWHGEWEIAAVVPRGAQVSMLLSH